MNRLFLSGHATMTRSFAVLPLAVIAVALSLPAPARAETVNCSRITSLPAVITTQGVYCMDASLSTAMASGNAITIGTHNVTLDCNGRVIDGLAAGPATAATGISAIERNNVTVRNCVVRGFRTGIRVGDDAAAGTEPFGALVENNTLDRNTQRGILVGSGSGIVRGNFVLSTGSETSAVAAVGIQTRFGVDIVDNTIDTVASGPGLGPTYGIRALQNDGGVIAGNRVRGLLPTANAVAIATANSSVRVNLHDNFVDMTYAGGGTAILCGGGGFARGNVMVGFTADLVGCEDAGGNFDYEYPN